MKAMDRRRFLALSAATATLPHLRAFAQAPTQTATLTLHPDKPGPRVPTNFIGLSYETQQLSEPTFFSAANTGLIAQFKALSPNGVLRLGGNTSDYSFWKPTPTSVAPPRAKRENKVGDPTPDLCYPVTPEAIHNLRAFLDATGWTCLYGINLGTNIPSLAADEAVYVSKVLGNKLEYFQLGNEADRFGTTIRDPKTWTADAFFDEWLTFANAIRAKVPYAKFGMPDIASDEKWFATLSNRLASMKESCAQYCFTGKDGQGRACDCSENPHDLSLRPNIACLSHHYYIGGPPSNPEMTIEHILKADPRVLKVAQTVQAAGAKVDAPWRMTEGNTCYRGGKPGVSDVFAASLWAADYLLQLASLGYAGVNLHGGEAKMVANSLGGTLPGDAIVLAEHGDPATHPHPYYTPIAHIGDQYVLEPVAYGMKFVQAFLNANPMRPVPQMMPIEFNPGAASASAYAAISGQIAPVIAIINKDPITALSVAVDFASFNVDYLRLKRLTAAGLRSTAITFAEDASPPKLTGKLGHSRTVVDVPPASALILEGVFVV